MSRFTLPTFHEFRNGIALHLGPCYFYITEDYPEGTTQRLNVVYRFVYFVNEDGVEVEIGRETSMRRAKRVVADYLVFLVKQSLNQPTG